MRHAHTQAVNANFPTAHCCPAGCGWETAASAAAALCGARARDQRRCGGGRRCLSLQWVASSFELKSKAVLLMQRGRRHERRVPPSMLGAHRPHCCAPAHRAAAPLLTRAGLACDRDVCSTGATGPRAPRATRAARLSNGCSRLLCSCPQQNIVLNRAPPKAERKGGWAPCVSQLPRLGDPRLRSCISRCGAERLLVCRGGWQCID